MLLVRIFPAVRCDISGLLRWMIGRRPHPEHPDREMEILHIHVSTISNDIGKASSQLPPVFCRATARSYYTDQAGLLRSQTSPP